MKNKTALVPVIMIGLLVTLTCKQWVKGGNDNVSNSPRNAASKPFTSDGKQWGSFDLKDTDLKVDFPGPPVDKSPQLPPGYKALFSAGHVYAYDEKDFQSSATELVPIGKHKLTIKDLADTSMTAIKKQLPNLTYTLDQRSDTNTRIIGSFDRNGKAYELRGCCVYKKTSPSRIWEVLAIYPAENGDARDAGQRVIESATFGGTTEDCR